MPSGGCILCIEQILNQLVGGLFQYSAASVPTGATLFSSATLFSTVCPAVVRRCKGMQPKHPDPNARLNGTGPIAHAVGNLTHPARDQCACVDTACNFNNSGRR